MSALGRLAIVIRLLPGRVLGLALTGFLLLPLAAGASAHRPQVATGATAVVEAAVYPAAHFLTGVGRGTTVGATPGVTGVAVMLAALAFLVVSANLAGMLLARRPRPRRTTPGAPARPGGP